PRRRYVRKAPLHVIPVFTVVAYERGSLAVPHLQQHAPREACNVAACLAVEVSGLAFEYELLPLHSYFPARLAVGVETIDRLPLSKEARTALDLLAAYVTLE